MSRPIFQRASGEPRNLDTRPPFGRDRDVDVAPDTDASQEEKQPVM
jgi:hypothetical protein